MYVPKNIVFEICERFVKGDSVGEIVAWAATQGFQLNRQQVYPQLRKAFAYGYLDLCPLKAEQISKPLIAHSQVKDIVVVDTHQERKAFLKELKEPTSEDNKRLLELLARETASKVVDLIKELGRRKETVHIGFSGGLVMERCAYYLSQALRRETERLPKIVIHALCCGFMPKSPTSAPISFFSHFTGLNVEFMAMFAEPVVDAVSYETLKSAQGVREAFALKNNIDIVITSLSARGDRHGLFSQFLGQAKNSFSEEDKAKMGQWVGDVQWRPYSKEGPIETSSGKRLVTLFELEELQQLVAKNNKHVVLLAGPCMKCGRSKARALLPLLTNERLNLINHLVLPVKMAIELGELMGIGMNN